MTKQTNSKTDVTKKDLIKIIEKIDADRTKQDWKTYSAAEKNFDDFSDYQKEFLIE